MTDRLALDRASVRSIDATSGHMHISSSVISGAAVNPYYGYEIPGYQNLGLQPDRVYNLLRDPEELAKGAQSFHGKPLHIVHRAQTAEDHDRMVVVGSVSNPVWDEPDLKAELAVWDQEGIDGIENETLRDLSAAYAYTPDMTPGTYQGQAFDGVMRNISGNHVTLCEDGRHDRAIVGDAKPKSQQEPRMSKATVSLSSQATAAQRGFAIYLKPRIAADAAIDLVPMLKGVTAKTWDARKAGLMAKVVAAAKPHLAADADLEDISEVIDMLDGVLPKVAEDSDDDDDDDEKKKKVAEDEDDDDKKKDDDKKPAMDAATVQRMILEATTAAKSEAVASMRAMRDAEEFVRPYIGPLAVAQDSAAAVYKLALDTNDVKTDGIPASAYKAMAESILPRIAVDVGAPKIAQDSAASRTAFAEMFPTASKLIRN